MVRSPALALSSLLFAAACAAGSPATPPSGGGTPGTPSLPGASQPTSSSDQQAIALGVSILSSDAAGAPRLIRSIVPRAAAAGMAPEQIARDHVAALAPLWIQQASPMQLVENGTQRLRNGATVVKFDQQIDGVVVEQGELNVLMHVDGSLAAVSGTLLPSTLKPVFASSPREAVGRALDQLYGATRSQPAITETGTTGGWDTVQIAADPTLDVSSARVRRELARVDGKVAEAWKIELIGTLPADPLGDPSITQMAAHSYLFADATGKLVEDANLTASDAFVYRVYADTTANRRPFDDGPLQSFAPHPTGIPDGSAPGIIPSNLVVMEAFNGPIDKWLPDTATTTSGNNAESFADLDANARFNTGDIRPEVRAGRVLNYTYDHGAEPLATVDQSKAASVNVFFIVNWMHDWWYDSGFTETTRNAQADNYGRGGVAGDPLLVNAQAGANTGLRNNADMSTPADGARPRMRMFLWTAGTKTSVTFPAGVISGEAFAAGPRSYDVTGELVAGVDGTAPINDGCQPITNAAGKIVLLTFTGVCGSLATVDAAKAAGAIGVILADGDLDNPRSFAGSAPANLPGLPIGRAGGLALQAALAAGPVTVSLHSEIAGVERDGDLDNGVVAHEWGHYMHHRLSVCGATAQCGGMSEGWGDFNALLLMLREGENRDGVYAMGQYALDDGTPDTAYYGIRRFPYSTDRTKNALSFRHIGDENPLPTTTPGLPGGANSEVHNTGEIWATMLWDVLNVLADEHGVTIARRRMTDYAVAGLLMMPPNASFTEARDSILAAASAMDTDDMTLMAAAFAGRGAGSCAVAPPIASATNAGVVESGTLAAILQAGGLRLTDDGISCDHDGILDPGESGNLHVTVANTGLFSADDVTVTATTANPGVRLGAALQVPSVLPHSTLDLSIPVTLLPTAPRNTPITITVHVAGLNTCARAGITLAITVPTGLDEAPAASKVDHVDTVITPWTKTGVNAAGIWSVVADSTGNKAWFGKDQATTSDSQLVSPALQVSPTDPLIVKISHSFDLENRFDGAVIEFSTNGGTTWADVASLGVAPGYTGTLLTGTGNALGGRAAFTGTSTGYPALRLVTMNFGTQLAGQSVVLRFRVGSDTSVANRGWNIDDIDVSGITNTPFPAQIAEPTTCTARKADVEDTQVIATHQAPAASLDAFDAAACIAGDTL
jgi:hypothetical protein